MTNVGTCIRHGISSSPEANWCLKIRFSSLPEIFVQRFSDYTLNNISSNWCTYISISINIYIYIYGAYLNMYTYIYIYVYIYTHISQIDITLISLLKAQRIRGPFSNPAIFFPTKTVFEAKGTSRTNSTSSPQRPFCRGESFVPKMSSFRTGWWLQPIWKILVKMGIFPNYGWK